MDVTVLVEVTVHLHIYFIRVKLIMAREDEGSYEIEIVCIKAVLKNIKWCIFAFSSFERYL